MLPWIIAGGFALYALLKEGEVAEKNQQIEVLQKDNLKLKEKLKELQEGFKELLCRYETLKIWVFKNMIINSDVENKLFKLWLLDDYLTVSIKSIKNESLTDDEKRFLDIVSKGIELMGQPSKDEIFMEQEKEFIRNFVYSRHKVKILAGEEPEIEDKLFMIEKEIRKELKSETVAS
jgi:hypothetical protein